MVEQADAAKATDLFTELHEHQMDKFRQDWTSVPKDHRAAVEAELIRQEKAYEKQYPHATKFSIKEDPRTHGLEVDSITTDAKGPHTKVEYAEAATDSRKGPIKPAQPAETTEQAAARQRAEEERKVAQQKAETDAYAKQFLGLLHNNTPEDSKKFATAYEALTPAQKAAVGKEMAKEEADNRDPNHVLLTQNPDGSIRKADIATHDEKGKPKLASEYRSPEETKVEAQQALSALRTHNKDFISSFDKQYKALSPEQQAALAREMQTQEAQYEATNPTAPKMLIDLDPVGGLHEVQIQGPGGRLVKEWPIGNLDKLRGIIHR